ncbi:MAG: hypothetical protein ACO38I_11050, partial [Ilumatobacteraceae bacterium]
MSVTGSQIGSDGAALSYVNSQLATKQDLISSATPLLTVQGGSQLNITAPPPHSSVGPLRVPPGPMTTTPVTFAPLGAFSVSASSESTGAAWKAFDGDTATAWVSEAGMYDAASGSYTGTQKLASDVPEGEYLVIEAPFAFVLDRFDIRAEDTPGDEHCTPEGIEIRAYDPYTGLWPQLLYYNLAYGWPTNGPRFNSASVDIVSQKITLDVDAKSGAYSKYAFLVKTTLGSGIVGNGGTSTPVRNPELTFYRRGMDLDAGQRLAPDLSNPKHPPVPLTGRITDDPVYGRFEATSDSQFGPIWQPHESFDAFTGFTSPESGWKSGADSYLSDGTFNPASANLAAQELVTGVKGAWLSLELPYTIFLKSLTLFPLNTGANSIGVNQFPSAINVYGTNALDPGQSDWTLLAALTGLSVPDTVTPLEDLAVDAPAAYRRFAFVILSTQPSNSTQSNEAGLGEVELYSKHLGDKRDVADSYDKAYIDSRLDGVSVVLG